MKQLRISAKKHQEVMDAFLAIIDSIENKEVKAGLNRLMDHMGERLFAAPASHNVAYHNCFVGGLVEHSLRVYTNLVKLKKAFAPQLSDDSI